MACISMVWLYINSASPDASIVGQLKQGAIRVKNVQGRSHAILNTIASLPLLKKQRSSIAGICVVSGPGSFSSIRTGVLIANVLSRELHIPLFGVDLSEAQDLEVLTANLQAGKIPAQEYVKPEYDTEPNITLPKTA